MESEEKGLRKEVTRCTLEPEVLFFGSPNIMGLWTVGDSHSFAGAKWHYSSTVLAALLISIAVAPIAASPSFSLSLAVSLAISSSPLAALPLMQDKFLALPGKEFNKLVVGKNSFVEGPAVLEFCDCSCRAGLRHRQYAESSSLEQLRSHIDIHF